MPTRTMADAEQSREEAALRHSDEMPHRHETWQTEPMATLSKNGAVHWILQVKMGAADDDGTLTENRTATGEAVRCVGCDARSQQ